jgi:hypothetical protein
VIAGVLLDYFRYLTLVIAFGTAAVVGAVAVIHFRRWREANGRWYGAKPRHVWEISLAYLLALAGLTGYSVSLVHHPFVWYATPMLMVSCVLALHALWSMTQFLGTVPAVPTAANPEPLSDAERARVLLRGLAILAVPLAFISLIPSLVGFYKAQQDENRTRALVAENASRLHEIQELRRQGAKNVKAAQLQLCRAQNRMSLSLRTIIRGNPKQAIRLLKVLGYSPAQTEAYLSANKKAVRQALAKLPVQNCKALPKPPSGSP